MEDQQKHAKVILGLIQVFWPEALIAGGAPRDWAYGHKANDIDIYLQADVQGEKVDSDELHIMFRNSRFKRVGKASYASYAEAFIKYVYEGQIGDETYQFIFCAFEPHTKPVTQIFNQFDTGICMAAYNGLVFTYDPRFLKDKENETITLYNSNVTQRQRERSIDHHIPKLQRYFPGYKVVHAE